MIILGNNRFGVSIAKQLVQNIQGIISLDGEIPLFITEQGIAPYVFSDTHRFILGELSHSKRSDSIEFISNYTEITLDTFPNIIAKDVNLAAINAIGYGNIIHSRVDLGSDCDIGNFNYIGIASTINSNSVLGSYNIIREHVAIGYDCSIKDYNILETKAVITDNTSIGNYNIVSHAECVFDNMLNQELFQSGIAQKIR